MVRSLGAELLKLRRTLTVRMIVVAPALAALIAVLAQSVGISTGRGDPAPVFWEAFSRSSFTLWAVFLLPLLIAIETAFLGNLEHGEKQWKHIFALPVPRYSIYLAKLGIAQALISASTLVLCGLIALSGWALIVWHPELASAGAPPIASIAIRAAECWLASGFILSINLWIALRWPVFTVPLGAGIAGTFFALFAASARVAAYYPWLLPLNVLSGESRATMAVGLGIGGGIVVAALGCIDFCRREESAPPQLRAAGKTIMAAVLLGFLAFAGYLDRQLLWRKTPYVTRSIAVDRNVNLEVLEWASPGRPIVLLAGLGDTAHVYERFASRLARDYHVYAITRRGFGASSHPSSGYAADRLGDDVLAVVDALKLGKPVLVGHSIAGEELSSIASRYPERIAGLVYLDAAYSYAYYDPARGDFNIDLFALDDKLQKLKPGSGVRDARPVLQDLVNMLPGFQRVLGQQLADLEALSSPPGQPSMASSNRQQKPGADAARAILAGERKYGAIHVPTLAIYALPHDMGSENPNHAAAEAHDIAAMTGPQARAFEMAMPSARVVRLPHASHYVFQSNEDDVIREMNAFIANLPK
jgi:pimeloyl-ACP methyl ester carboxylesterase